MSAKSKKVVADICLYGTSRTGAGFIVCELKHGRTSGTGEPDLNRSFTEACWMGVGHLQALGVEKGLVRIFEPSGQKMAVVDVNNVPAFGSLKWEPAVQWVMQVAG